MAIVGIFEPIFATDPKSWVSRPHTPEPSHILAVGRPTVPRRFLRLLPKC